MVMSTMLIWFLEFLPHFFVGKLILNWTTVHILLKWVETQPPTCQQVMIFECFVSMRRYPDVPWISKSTFDLWNMCYALVRHVFQRVSREFPIKGFLKEPVLLRGVFCIPEFLGYHFVFDMYPP